ncbi:MAG: DnaD domain protein [Anaerotignaceae bacterium]
MSEESIIYRGVNLSAEFIERFLSQTPPQHIMVYIFIKSIAKQGRCYVNDISKLLNIPPTEVFDISCFWHAKGLIKFEDGCITLPYEQAKEIKKVRASARPEYQAQELSMYAKNNIEIKSLFNMAENYLGRVLTHNDLSCIFALHHWLGLTIDVIEKLLKYCTDNNHRNMRYIESVAIDWAENGITTVSLVEEKIKLFNTDFRQIMRALGQSNRNPIKSEEKTMTKWIKEYKLPMEVIEFACEKTIQNTGKASFAYADKILSGWHSAGVKHKDDILFLEKTKEKERAKEKPPQKTKTNGTKSMFGAYEQREYDYAAYEDMEFNRIKGE